MSHLSELRIIWKPFSCLSNRKWGTYWWASKILHYSCEDGIEKSIPRDHHLSLLCKPCDANRWSSGWIFLSHPHTHVGFLYAHCLNNFSYFLTVPCDSGKSWTYSLVFWIIIALYIENTRWVSFDIKFSRQGFENTCWHREACQTNQHAFSKPSLLNLISKYANLVLYFSAYQVGSLFKLANMTQWSILFPFNVIGDVIQKVQRYHELIKLHAMR